MKIFFPWLTASKYPSHAVGYSPSIVPYIFTVGVIFYSGGIAPLVDIFLSKAV